MLAVAFGSGILFVSASSLWTSDLTGSTDEFVEYIGQNPDFSFKKPSSWHVYEILDRSYVRVENLDGRSFKTLPAEIQRQYFKIEVVVLPNPSGLSLSDWVFKQNTTSYPLPRVLSQQSVEVAGQPAVYQIEQFGTLIHPVVFLQKDERIYILNISSRDERFKLATEKFIHNFEFASE